MKYLTGILTIPISTLVVSYFLCRAIIYFSHKKGLLDLPNEFRQHDTPTPYFGGIAIFTAISINYIILTFITGYLFYLVWVFVFGMFFFIGLIDDIFKLSSIPKLILIIIASIITPAFFDTSLISYLIISLCLVFFTNSFNLLDNIDGLCASTALAILLALIIQCHQLSILTLTFIVPFFAIAGFLILNLPKAKIFMGDTGSLLIGAICVMFVVISLHSRNLLCFKTFNYLPLFWLPIYDTSSVIIVRINAGKSILLGGKDHFSHRLMKRGMSNSAVVVLLFIITLSAGIISHYLSPLFSIALFIFIVASAASFELLTSEK